VKRLSHPLAVLAVVLLGLTGCSSSPTRAPDPEPTLVPFPADFPSAPDLLMARFQAAYVGRDSVALAAMLRPAFVTLLQQSTRNTFPDVGETLNRAEQVRITGRMFRRQDLFDPNYNLVPAITSIQVTTFQRVGIWSQSPGNDQIPNAWNALFSLQVIFNRGPSFSPMMTAGNMRFYMTVRDSTALGETHPYYQLAGVVDLTDAVAMGPADKGSESSSWGSIHALFR
jgi:hypothetical protein